MRDVLRAMRMLLLPAFFLLILMLLFLHAEDAMGGIRQALSLCTQTLIPSLFPFLVFTELLIALGGGELLGRLLGRPVGALFGLSSKGASAVLLGAVCGQPIGTVSAVSLYQRGEISDAEVRRISLFANNPSSGFLISAVGVGLFKRQEVGVALFCIVQISAMITGISLRFLFGKVCQIKNIPQDGTKKSLSVQDLTNGVGKALSSMLHICAFVLFFSCIAGCLEPFFESFPAVIEIALFGTLEMTSGISRAATALSPAGALRATAFFSGFAGLSVFMQIFSVSRDAAPAPLSYLCAKLVQGCVALSLTEVYLRVFRPVLTPIEAVTTLTPIGVSRLPWLLPMFVFLLCFFIIKKRKRLPIGIR